jgi:DNA-binding transcriptional ArsR family regulator
MKLTLDTVFSSIGKAKILQTLAEEDELNISELIRRTTMNHTTAIGHLKDLMDLGFIQEKVFGRIKIYKYRTENPNAQALKRLIEYWNERPGISGYHSIEEFFIEIDQ